MHKRHVFRKSWKWLFHVVQVITHEVHLVVDPCRWNCFVKRPLKFVIFEKEEVTSLWVSQQKTSRCIKTLEVRFMHSERNRVSRNWIYMLWMIDVWSIIPSVKHVYVNLQYTKVTWKIYKLPKFRAPVSVCRGQIWKQRLCVINP